MPQLKPFQQEGAAFLASRTRALLGDEPGVGKTGQLITAAQRVGAQRIGVVCPSIGVRHWEREFRKWWGGAILPRLDIIAWDDAHKVQKQLAAENRQLVWDALILDEVHFGKNPHARRTRSTFAKGGLVYHANRLWAASGTPAPNHVGELWPMLRAFGKTKMDQEMFTSYYCYVDPMTGKVRGNRPERVEEIRAILKSFALRRRKKDVLPELGALSIEDWYVEPSTAFIGLADRHEAACLSAHLEMELQGKSGEELLAFLAGDEEFATLRKYNALLKAPAVFDAVKFELENGLLDKVVVFGIHTDAMKALHEAFRRANIPSTLIIGETPLEMRDGLIEEWKRSGRVLIASSIIASTVLDFTCAHEGIMLELDWVPGNNKQAMERMHRFGQENPVRIRVAHGTHIDEVVNGVVIQKVKQLAEIFD